MTLIVLLATLGGCVIELKDKGETGTSLGQDDTGGGGGNLGDQWRARGKGQVTLLDGTRDHSLVVLEVTGTIPPREDEAYHGWLMGTGLPDLYLGELPVSEDVVLFEHDVGLNAFLVGYTRFEAWAVEGTPSGPGEGDALWAGEIPTDAVDILRELLVISDTSSSGEGSLRAIETTVETVQAYGQDAIDNYAASGDDATNLKNFHEKAEGVANGIRGTEVDMNSSGAVTVVPGLDHPLVGDDGHAALILAHLDDAFVAFGGQGAEDEVRDALGDAYDCVQNIESHSDEAADKAGLATVCGAETACISIMKTVNENLDYALVGEDLNSNGVIDSSEGTIECAIEQLSGLMATPVSVP